MMFHSYEQMLLRLEQNWKWSNKTFHTLCIASPWDETTQQHLFDFHFQQKPELSTGGRGGGERFRPQKSIFKDILHLENWSFVK